MMFDNDIEEKLWSEIAKAVREKDYERIVSLGKKMPGWGNMVRNHDVIGLINHDDPRAIEFAVLAFWKDIPEPIKESSSKSSQLSVRTAATISRITALLAGEAQKAAS
ncbi:MAG: hypothetical protein WC386_02615 [Candidatus Paceibacterota bacterium]|jgi:hypothetical protein